ncbi:MAG TPA: flagellar motor protein MotB [Planctomycetaceae bacterium]|nr:flagellar motor protein MotB [Planctomycetaceae bacterium]
MPPPPEDQGESIPEWVVTFGDMMSLLLTFFVLLFSMSEIKEDQLQALIQSLRKEFGHATATVSLMPGHMKPITSAPSPLSSMGRAMRAHTMNGGAKVPAPVGDFPPVRAARSGNQTAIGGIIFFRPGQSELDPQSRQALENTAAVIRGKPQKVRIRGHTSPRPLDRRSPYMNHWDLAYARCFAVMDKLVELGIDSRRLLLEVVAENEPPDVRAEAVDPDKARDRVEVVLLDQFVEDPGGPPGRDAGIP